MMLLGYPNRFDLLTLSGGGFTSGLPRSYMLTRQLDQRARFASSLKRDTWFYATGTSAVSMGVAALCGNNFSTDAQCRWRGFSADPRGAFDSVFTGGSMPSGWALTRTGGATYFDADGVLQTAATDVARFGYTAGVCDGLMIEAAATNSTTYCRDGSNAAWTKSNATATKTATGIDGVANSATVLTATGSTGRISQAGANAVFSVYLRRVTGSGAIKITGDNFGTTTTCVLTTSWQRFSVARSSNVGIQIDTNGDVIEFDFAQDEDGSTPTSPIATTSSAVTRNADTLTYSGGAAAGVNFTAGAFLLYGELLKRPTSGTPPLVQVGSSAGGADYVRLDMATSGAQSLDLSATTSQVTGLTSSAIAVGDEFRASASWAANDVKASFDGGAALSDASATMPAGTVTTINVAGASGLGFNLLRLKFYPAAKTGTQLAALSGSGMEVASDFDSGWYDAWPADYLSSATSEMIAAATTPALHKPAAAQSYQYWRIDVDDEANTDGYVEIGRPFMGAAWQPTYNASYGAGVGFVDLSSSVRAYGGARYFEDTRNPRSFAFSFDALSDSEAWTKAYELLSQQGSTKEVLFSWSPADLSNIPRQTFLCTITALDGLTAASYGMWSKAFRVEELL